MQTPNTDFKEEESKNSSHMEANNIGINHTI
jgi:hypothetical protein